MVLSTDLKICPNALQEGQVLLINRQDYAATWDNNYHWCKHPNQGFNVQNLAMIYQLTLTL